MDVNGDVRAEKKGETDNARSMVSRPSFTVLCTKDDNKKQLFFACSVIDNEAPAQQAPCPGPSLTGPADRRPVAVGSE